MKFETICTILFLFLGHTSAASDKVNAVRKTVDPFAKHRELNSIWSTFLNLIHPPDPLNHSMVAGGTDTTSAESSTDTTSAASAQSDVNTSSSSSNESFEYTAEDQNDTEGAAVSTISSASVWIYIVSGAVLLSLIGVAYKKRREEVNVVAKVNLMDEENVSTVEAETQRKKAPWWTKFRLRKKKQTEVQMVSV